MRPFWIAILVVAVLAEGAFAEVSLRAKVDKLELSAGQTLTYELTVISSGKNLPQPQLPEFKGFRVLSSGQSSSIAFGAGEVKITNVYVYLLAPDGPGKFTIEPSRIKQGDGVYSSEEFEIEVKEGKFNPQGPGEAKPPKDDGRALSTEAPKITL